MKLVRLDAICLEARFADLFGGADRVPLALRAPASHFQRIPRTGQMATLVVVESDDGATGWGEAFGLPHPGAAKALLDGVIGPALLGSSVGEPAAMTADLARYFAAMGHTRGPAMEALSAVDIALWDLKARAAGVPLATLLGASPGAVPTYVSPVAFQATPDASAAAARAYLDQGFTAMKLKIGRGLATDVEHVAAVRDAVGPGTPLTVDVNCAYDVPTAVALARALAPFALGWIEEPIPPDDPAALAEVRRASPVPIAAGENEFTLRAHEALVAAGAVDVLQPNIARSGGVSGLLAIGALCERAGIRLAPHGVGTCVGVAAALHACRAAPSVLAYEANRLLNPLRDELGTRRIALADGQLVATDVPGHGGEPDPAQLRRFRLRSASHGEAHADPGA